MDAHCFIASKNWSVNSPEELAAVLKALKLVQRTFNKTASGGKRISLADPLL